MEKAITNINAHTSKARGKREKHERKTYRVEDCADILDIGRSSAYKLVRKAEKTGEPFVVLRVGNILLISKRSFDEFLDVVGL